MRLGSSSAETQAIQTNSDSFDSTREGFWASDEVTGAGYASQETTVTASADTTNRVGRVRLSVQIKDFGPISSGSIEIRPLTLFIGPNNSGKSYAAMLIHALLESYTQFD